jgi:dipeptidyl aminopeptidase/acylaminoacyl peptidase
MATGDLDKLALAVDRLDRLSFLSDLTFDRKGDAVAAALRPATRESNESYQSRIWRYSLDGSGAEITHGPNGDYSPRYSPVDERLAFTSDRTTKGKADLFILEDGAVRPLGDIPGTIEDLRWTDDGTALFVLAADRGLDGGATNGAKRLVWGNPEDPLVDNPKGARRRIFKVDAKSGATLEVGPADLSVWEFSLLETDAALVLVSDDPSERGWYHTRLAWLDFKSRLTTTLHESSWQLLSPSVSPSGKSVAFLEGWSSDRGLVASEIRILHLATGKVDTISAAEAADVTSFEWLDDESLSFAGWSKIGSIYGTVRTDGKMVSSQYEDAIIGTKSFSAQISLAPDKAGFAAVRETVGEPPEIVFKSAAGAAWKPVTKLNGPIASDFNDYPEVRALRWRGADGLEIDGLVLLPRDREPGPRPTIVDIHGGPSWTAKYAFNPGYALPLAAAGYAVFLPNYRGNTGWGQKFAKLNIGDPGGAEFDDILAGIDRCIADGMADGDRLGVTGTSYGGYMTAWAVATTAALWLVGHRQSAQQPLFLQPRFSRLHQRRPANDKQNRDVALDRSPFFRLDRPTTPTLILHGNTIVARRSARRGIRSLTERGVPWNRLSIREGHGLQERGHRLDGAADCRGSTDNWTER